MIPKKPIPYPDCWDSPGEYVDGLLDFATNTDIFQILCGGVHILDFFTNDPGLFQQVLPRDWQEYLLRTEPMKLLDVLMRDDLDSLPAIAQPPETLLKYIKQVRSFLLAREFSPKQDKVPKMTRMVSVGMKPKKIHEVSNFASYVDKLGEWINTAYEQDITHYVDFGSGQNYLGRTLASSPYNKQIVAVEGRENNIKGAKELDMLAGIAEKEKVMRNKKVWLQVINNQRIEAGEELDDRSLKQLAKSAGLPEDVVADIRPRRDLTATYKPEEGKGFIRYISGRLESGDLSDVVDQMQAIPDIGAQEAEDLRLMAISIHSCGNLSHFGIRSLILNPRVRAVAIVGCCYNLMTEKLGPPAYKLPYMRPSLQAINGRVVRESERRDPEGFPMSERLSKHQDKGVRFNITARMMAVQAPQNWTEVESDGFFTRHFFRAVLQKVFLDRGVITKVYHSDDGEKAPESAFNMSTSPIIIGSLSKGCYGSLNLYIRGAIKKLTTHSDYHTYCDTIQAKMSDITDEEIARYERIYLPRKRELSAIWSMMAFSAGVVESLIATDRWLFLKEHPEVVDQCWVETVFDYRESPRNLVVVGIKNGRT